MIKISDRTFDEERALYNTHDAEICGCTFAGPADGESAMKECSGITVRNCSFSLRYPLWHTSHFELRDSVMDELTRAALWYASDGVISGCTLNGIKCLRECDRISLEDVSSVSPEFGWKCRGITMTRCDMTSEYFLLEGQDICITNLNMKGKYSFQYTENVEISDSVLNTKDAFWHSKNVTVRDSEINGEYLGWYSDGLTLINCRISGTQPLCYCKNLTLVNCTMTGTDLSFEYSDVSAEISGGILSVKNPRSGNITADSIGEVILEQSVMETTCEIHIRGEKEAL